MSSGDWHDETPLVAPTTPRVEYEVACYPFFASTFDPSEVGAIIAANINPGATCTVSLRIHY